MFHKRNMNERCVRRMDKRNEKILLSFGEEINARNKEDKVIIFSNGEFKDRVSKLDDFFESMEEESMLMVVHKEDCISLFAPIELNWMFLLDEDKSGFRIKKL